MKKKWAIAAAAVLLTLFCGFLWWNTPVTLLKNVSPKEIAAIYIFDRETGETLFLGEPEDIEYIVTNIRETVLRREWFSQEYADFRFDLTFFGVNGGIVDEFRVISANAIQRGSAYYGDEASGICFGYLEDLEAARLS